MILCRMLSITATTNDDIPIKFEPSPNLTNHSFSSKNPINLINYGSDKIRSRKI